MYLLRSAGPVSVLRDTTTGFLNEGIRRVARLCQAPLQDPLPSAHQTRCGVVWQSMPTTNPLPGGKQDEADLLDLPRWDWIYVQNSANTAVDRCYWRRR